MEQSRRVLRRINTKVTRRNTVAVVQISRIQHRSGVSDNLPQLARGEIGIAVDTRKVYIGNGGPNAPQIENLELLTNLSSLIESSNSYTYSDIQIGFSAQTGTSANSPITRTLQNKLDDFASVRDFGAVGDGITDDTLAINRALYELFAKESIHRVRRSLFFPAGDYRVSDTILIPAYAKIYGEGPNSSTISSKAGAGDAYVVKTTDSKQQTDATIGTNGASRPRDILVNDITFTSSTDRNVLLVEQSINIKFENCSFVGPNTNTPAAIGNGRACAVIKSSGTNTTNHINFENCVFSNHVLGILADNDMNNIVLNGCQFDTLFKGLKIGELVTGSAPSVLGPRGMCVTNSLFDNVYDNGIHIYKADGFISAFNRFNDVANNGSGSGSPSTHVINYAANNAHSIADVFLRPDSDDSNTTRRVNVDAGHTGGLAFDNNNGVKFGGYIRDFGRTFALANNTTASTGITFPDSAQESAIEIDYMIERNNRIRQGKLVITHDNTSQVIDDEFSENNGDVGVTFSLTNGSNITTLNYTTDNSVSGTLNYSIRILR